MENTISIQKNKYKFLSYLKKIVNLVKFQNSFKPKNFKFPRVFKFKYKYLIKDCIFCLISIYFFYLFKIIISKTNLNFKTNLNISVY